jgi:hypothetical protein
VRYSISLPKLAEKYDVSISELPEHIIYPQVPWELFPDWQEYETLTWWTGPVRGTGHLGGFLQTYNLTWLFTLFCASAVTGIIILLHSFYSSRDSRAPV